MLVKHGAHEATTVATVDRLADLFAATYVGWWEWAARRDPILARLGLSPDQCVALVALLAGSRHYRHNGKHDSLLAAVRNRLEDRRRRAGLQLQAGSERREPEGHLVENPFDVPFFVVTHRSEEEPHSGPGAGAHARPGRWETLLSVAGPLIKRI